MNKQLAIADVARNQAMITIRYESYIRKKPRIFRKKKFSKKKANMLQINMFLSAYMSAAHVAVIIAQPMHKYPQGAIVSRGKVNFV